MDGIADWHGRPAPVWTFAVFAAAASLLCVVGIAVGTLAPQQVVIHTLAAVVGAAGATLLWFGGRRASPRHLTLGLVAAAVVLTAMVGQARTGEGAASIAVGFSYLTVHAALFSPRRTARAIAAVGVVGCAVGLTISVPGVSGALAWVLLSTTTVLAGEALAVLFHRVRALSLADELTGLLNRSGFALAVERERAAARRSGESLVLAVVDLDGFKAVNDAHGHDAGDRLLVELARGWRQHLRPRDVVGRLGGDEFALALPGTRPEQADVLLARLHEAAPVSFSSGAVVLTALEPLDEALHRADQRMYRAKRRRRAAHGGDLGLQPLEAPPTDDAGPAQPIVEPGGPSLPQLDGVRP